jgi:plasmid stability protein
MARRTTRSTPIAESAKHLLYVPEALLEKCRVRAAASHRSLNSQIEWLIESGLMIEERRVMPSALTPEASPADEPASVA